MREILFRWFPPAASDQATQVDLIFFVLCGITLFFAILISFGVVFLSVRYRRKQRSLPPDWMATNYKLEAVWTIIPFFIEIAVFIWGARVFLARFSNPPSDAYEVSVLGKQWMWKFEHPNGRRENNELHLPLGKPVRLVMISQDVIHDVFVPAFRLKHDVLPMRYTSLWFTPTKLGHYHLFCAQYCGTLHSQMGGFVDVMEPEAFQSWLGSTVGQSSAASDGKALLRVLGCRSCHRTDSLASAPRLEGLYGGQVELSDGSVVTADADYIRSSILDPATQVVAHFQPVMPSYRGRITEEEIFHIIDYLKSVSPENTR